MKRKVLGAFIGYIALTEAGFALAGQASMTTPFRPASGLALAVLVVLGRRLWPAVFAASLIVAAAITRDPLLSVTTALGHTLAAVAGSWLIGRFADGRDVFRKVQSTLRAVTFVVASACVPAASLLLFATFRGGIAEDPWSTFLGAWLGQVTGTLVVAPCVLIVLTAGAPRFTRDRWPATTECAALFISLAVVSLGVFAGYFPSHVKTYPLEFLCLPFLLWAAFRFGPREVMLAVAMLSGIAVWGTLRGVGPFADGDRIEAVWLLQAYVTVTSITGIAFATVVDERRRAEQQLQELATTDPLTGLVNYRRLLDVLRLEMARSRRTGRSFGLLLVDMDGLKTVNDRFGHLAGSRAICRVADALRGCTRETDIVSRFGGDEFAIVLSESGDEGGDAVMGRVSEKLAADRTAPLLSVSGGYAVFPRDGDSPTLLLRAADRHLYAAKHRGDGAGVAELVELTATA